MTFGLIDLDMIPGVDIGAPALAIEFPEPELCIDAEQVTVQGIVSDDIEVASVVVVCASRRTIDVMPSTCWGC